MLVESGDFLFSQRISQGPPAAPQIARAELILRAYRRMGYDAVLPGEVDLSAGVPFLVDEMKRGIPFTCLNLVSARSGKPVFAPFRIFARGGLRILVTGVLGEALFPGISASGPWRILPPRDTLEAFLGGREAAGADLIVLLSHHDREGSISLARRTARPLLVFAGHSGNRSRNKVLECGSALFQPRNKGTHLVEVAVGRHVDGGRNRHDGFSDGTETERNKEKLRELRKEMEGVEPGRRILYEKAAEAYDRAIRAAERKIRLEHRAIPLDAGVPEDPQIATMVADRTRKMKTDGDRER